jgi:biopolymer transport protein ExbD
MQLSSRKGSSTALELQLTSMIDVTFLLLIFFMITSSFHKAERELDPLVKVDRLAAKAKPALRQPAIIDIVAVGPQFVMRLGGRDFTTAQPLVEVLQQLDSREEGAVVRVPPEAPFELAATAIQACKSAGYTQVSYVPTNP